MSIMKAAAIAGVCVGLARGAASQEFNDKPLQDNWWPSEWGPDDKVGAPNRTTPEIVLEAVQLVKQARPRRWASSTLPIFPSSARADFSLHIPGTPTGGPFGSNRLVFHDELVTAEIGQVGTNSTGQATPSCAAPTDHRRAR